MTAGSGMIGFFLNYATFLTAALLFVAAAVLLLLRRRRLPPAARTLLAVLLVVSAVYFAFVLWVVLASGRLHPIAPPVSP